jgi:NAD(P)-dependent dehydrogenase (short-subunit alcohol dehydrogenase family)
VSNDAIALPAAAGQVDAAALAGRSVLVVGASGAYGTAIARACARAGATVVLAGRRVPALERLYDELTATGGQAALYPINLEGAQPDDFDTLGATLLQEFGGIDGIVFAAGRLHGLAALEHHDGQEWLRTWHLHLNVPFLLLRGCLAALRAKQGALLLCMDDPARTDQALWGAYGVAQGGLRSFLQMAGEETARLGPRVYGLLLPPSRSQLNQRAFPALAPEEFTDPATIAPAAVWALASDAASGSLFDARALAD